MIKARIRPTMMALFVFAVYMWWKKRIVDKTIPPTYAPGIPLLGGFIAFASDPLGCVREARKACGDSFTIPLLTENVTFLIGPKPHTTFFNATDEELDQADVYRFMVRCSFPHPPAADVLTQFNITTQTPIFGKGVVYDVPLKKRREQLKALAGALKPVNLREYPRMISSVANKYFEEKLGESGEVDIHQMFADLIIKTGSSALMGPEISNELFDEMFQLYQDLDKGLTPLSVFFPHAPTEAHRKRDVARKNIGELFDRIVQRRLAEGDTSKYNDVVQRMMDFTYTDGEKLNGDQIAGMMVATLFAAQHTSNVTATWTTLFLLEDLKTGGNLLQRVKDEMRAAEPEDNLFMNGKGVEHQVLVEQPFLHACIKEAIRLFPPIIFLMRRAMVDLPLEDGTHVPKGNMVMVSNAVAQRLETVFDNPNTYQPDRWSTFDMGKLPKFSFIGFGAGLHTCMGESFAFLQVRTILDVLLSKYELELTTTFPTPDYEAMVVMPHGPNMVKYTRKPEVPAALMKPPKPIKTKSAADAYPKLVPTTASGADGKPVFSAAEVAKHNTREDLWIIVNGLVYDITTYVHLHQGGEDALFKIAGKDGTAEVEGPQHPGTVPQLLSRFEIGKLGG